MIMNIDVLPNELLSKIFACLSLKHDLDSVQLVSKRWQAVVDETIGREVAITSLRTEFDFSNGHNGFPCVPHAHLGCLGFDMVSRMGVTTCYVDLSHTDIATAGDLQNPSEESFSIPTFKYPHLLRHLYLSGTITSDIFGSLIHGTENLVQLQLNLLALSQLPSSSLNNLRLPRLKALGVSKCLKATGRDFDDTLGLSNLQILLEKNTFSFLKQLDLRFPIQNFKDFGTIKAVLTFISVHSVLTDLYLTLEFPVQVNILRSFQEELETLMKCARKHRNRGSLKICDIQGLRLHASYPQLKIWQAFLEQQEALKTLTLRLGNLPARFLESVCSRNKGSLENLFLYKLNEIMDDDPGAVVTTLDCRVFAAPQLQTLFALGCDAIIHVKSLPRSLTTLFLSRLISSEEVEYILFELPHLQFASLKNACLGRQAGFGVSLDLLRRFVEIRKMKRLILNGSSLSEDYPVDGLSNGDPKNPTRLMEFDNWDVEHVYLDWELNKDMYYVDKCYGLNNKLF